MSRHNAEAAAHAAQAVITRELTQRRQQRRHSACGALHGASSSGAGTNKTPFTSGLEARKKGKEGKRKKEKKKNKKEYG